MRALIAQPRYSFRSEDADECFAELLSLFDACTPDADIIVFPEYCDVPVSVPDAAAFAAMVAKYNAIVYEKASATAKRCGAMLFANFADCTATGLRNTTYAFDREGVLRGKYYKAHPAPSEVKTAAQGGNELDCSYSYEYAKPYTIEMQGLRFGFETCYDFYMYEEFPVLARENVDIIIGCSHQRTDTHDALETIGKFLCYNTNAYLLRSAVTLGPDSPVCGCSMAVAPDGKMLLNMRNECGLGVCDFDPAKKYTKAAGFKGRELPHWQYIEEGRRPWLYRPSGSMMSAGEKYVPYPRVCAHRGFNTIAPENSMPAFGAAVALGADEIEFDLWSTKDGELVSAHDKRLERVSDGTGYISDYTLEELRAFDFGSKCNEHYKGLQIITFEDILRKFAGTVIMNIHVKIWDEAREHPETAADPQYERIVGLLRQYGAEKHAYMMTSCDKCMREFHEIAPDIARCVGFDGVKDDPLRIVNRAIAMGCEKVQLFKPYFDQSSVDLAHANGILCNVFFADDPDEAQRYLEMGIDTILTNDYFSVSRRVRAFGGRNAK